jgi:hypothetical protein
MVGVWLEEPKLELSESVSELRFGRHAIRELPAFLI